MNTITPAVLALLFVSSIPGAAQTKVLAGKEPSAHQRRGQLFARQYRIADRLR